MGSKFSHGKALASQSLTPPNAASQAVCGEYRAMDLAKHMDTIRSFQFL